MSYTCEIKQQPAQPTLSIHTHAPVQDLPRVFGYAFNAIMQYLGELGQTPTGMPFALYKNMDMQNLDLEIGFPVSAKYASKGEIQPSEIPAGKYANTLHVGPYDQIAPAYEALTQYAIAQGYTPTGVAYEFYMSEPETPPQEIKTLVAFPLH